MLPPLISRGDHTELLCKVFLFLLKIHHAPIVANNVLLPTLMQLQKLVSEKATELRVSVHLSLIGATYSVLFVY